MTTLHRQWSAGRYIQYMFERYATNEEWAGVLLAVRLCVCLSLPVQLISYILDEAEYGRGRWGNWNE